MDDVMIPDLMEFEIPLIFKKKKIGIIEKIGFIPSEDFPSIKFEGKLFHMMDKPDVLVKLLQKEGIHLGE